MEYIKLRNMRLENNNIRLLIYYQNQMINRRYGWENNQKRQFNQDHHQQQFPTKKATFFKRPSISLSHEDKENHNYEIHENQMSTLEKYAQASNKISQSKVLEDNQSPNYENTIANLMKFSFNQNYTKQTEDYKLKDLNNNAKVYEQNEFHNYIRQEQRLLNKYQEKESFNRFDENPQIHQFSISSIKKGKNNTNFNVGAQQQITKQLTTSKSSKQKGQSQVNRLDNLTQRLNIMFLKDKSNRDLLLKNKENKHIEEAKQNQTANFHSNLNTKEVSILKDNYADKKYKVISSSSCLINKEKPVLAHNKFFDRIHYIQILFDKLNHDKTDYLTKDNCCIAKIRDQLKFLFGIVFSRIFIQELSKNKVAFVEECIEAIRQLEPNQLIYQYLRELDPFWEKNQHQCIQQNSDLQHKEKSKIRALYSNDYKLDASPEINSLDSSVDRKFSLLKLNGNSNEQKYQEEKKVKYNRSHLSSLGHYQRPPFYPQQSLTKHNIELLTQRKDTTKKEKLAIFAQVPIDTTKPFKKKIRNISQQMIREHKRNLSHIFILNQKIQYYLQEQKMGDNSIFMADNNNCRDF